MNHQLFRWAIRDKLTVFFSQLLRNYLLLRKLMIHYCAHKMPYAGSHMNHSNPARILTSCSFRIHFNVIPFVYAYVFYVVSVEAFRLKYMNLSSHHACCMICRHSRLFLSLAQQPNDGQGRLILEVCRSHIFTHHSR